MSKLHKIMKEILYSIFASIENRGKMSKQHEYFHRISRQ